MAVLRLRPWVILPGWLALSALLLLYPLFRAGMDRYQFVPFIAGLVLLGLPHGAMDHLVIPHIRGEKLRPRPLGAFILGYGACILLYLALWRLQPLGALALFLLLSWLHWGQGDAYFLREFGGRRAPRTPAGLWLIWAVRGALPILLPPLMFPAFFQDFSRGILRWYAPTAIPWQITPLVRTAGLGLIVALLVLSLIVSWVENGDAGRGAFRLDAGEVTLLFAVFARVPPVLAVGVYFCVWHSWRHIARLMLTDPVSEALIANGRLGRAVGRSALQSLPMTGGALALLGALYATRGHSAASAGDFVYLYLSLIAALTFPHFLLVLWMDRQQGAWRVTGPASGLQREQLT